ncbi:protein D2-like isoform X2 [Uranotaenia lowii]|uniref:protein D2-like isoform X2 n=1 Tax=Uranotaenia lowii TaxID=190385 RepID=UPI00247A089A|nr:protein D2-like isoform X2 [Uranotaenia lowii]
MTAEFVRDFKNHKIVPDVVPVPPESVLQITYPGELQVNLGNILMPREVKDEPVVKWTAEPNGLYTLCMTDPDAPSRTAPKFREWHHWLVVNIPGCAIDRGELLSEYIGAGPPKKTGLHRYVFLVYKQNERLNCTEKRLNNRNLQGRGKFSIRKFSQKYHLSGPLAGNFFQAQFQED